MLENDTSSLLEDGFCFDKEKETVYDTIPEAADTNIQQTENNNQSRWRSPALWSALIGLLGTIGFSTGLFAKIGLDSDTWTAIGTCLSAILAAFGIANNPTNKGGF